MGQIKLEEFLFVFVSFFLFFFIQKIQKNLDELFNEAYIQYQTINSASNIYSMSYSESQTFKQVCMNRLYRRNQTPLGPLFYKPAEAAKKTAYISNGVFTSNGKAECQLGPFLL
jgi:hypothetical protein